jgi:hypothetical protein
MDCYVYYIYSLWLWHKNTFGKQKSPRLSSNLSINKSVTRFGYIQIAVLPPRSDTIITASLDVSMFHKNETLITYVKSDERVGFHDIPYTIGFYFVLSAIHIMLFLYFSVSQELKLPKSEIAAWGLGPIAWIDIFTIIYLIHYHKV